MDEETCVCRKCAQSVAIRDGEEHTGFCDGCAQEMIADLVETLESIRDHNGIDENNCAMDLNEIQQHFRDLAAGILDRYGIGDFSSNPDPLPYVKE